ncbi:MAG: hypothetical protein QOC91_121 [Solirubrobacteraceae bacterium]|jgi:hypothetical protein|nr:hypothetical protein [Solirubrobacteraceae bacterium]MEA2334533.1 hypothetical protein [Solirubrobacteraceae bacterium]
MRIANPIERLGASPRARARAARRHSLLAVSCLALAAIALAGGCGTGHPKAIGKGTLAEAQTFPYFRLYWVGPSFLGHPLAAADGQKGYISSLGDSVYYGDCVKGKGIFGGGSCILPLQVTTVVYRLHSNATLGRQRNVVVRGVPATVYDEGRSIEVYTGRVAIDLFSNTFAHAYAAARALRPLNAPGSAAADLPPPIYCPGLSGPQSAELKRVMSRLPARACQRASAALAFAAGVHES